MDIKDKILTSTKKELQSKFRISQSIQDTIKSEKDARTRYVCYEHTYNIFNKNIGEAEFLFRPDENRLFLNLFYPLNEFQELIGQKTHISTLAYYESLILVWQHGYQNKYFNDTTTFEIVKPTTNIAEYLVKALNIHSKSTCNLNKFIEIVREYGNSKGFKF